MPQPATNSWLFAQRVLKVEDAGGTFPRAVTVTLLSQVAPTEIAMVLAHSTARKLHEMLGSYLKTLEG